MKHTTILIIVDTERQSRKLIAKNAAFIHNLTLKTRNQLEGSNINIRFVTASTLEARTCGLCVDAVINLSSIDPERIRDSVMPCLMSALVV